MDCSAPSSGISSQAARYKGRPAPPRMQQCDEGHPDDRRVEIEIGGDPAGGSGDHAPMERSHHRPVRGCAGRSSARFCAHGFQHEQSGNDLKSGPALPEP